MQTTNQTAGRLVTLFLALAMAVGFAAVPAAVADEADRHERTTNERDAGLFGDGIELIPDVSATDIAVAGANAEVDPVSSAQFVELPPDAEDVGAHGISTEAAVGFPTDGDTFAVISNGEAEVFHHEDEFPSGSLGGDTVRGDSDNDVTVMEVELDAADALECVSMDYRFLTDEFAGGSFYTDGFVIEEGTSEWTTESADIVAPDALAVESAYDSADELDSEHSEGTPYFYGTPTKTVTAPIDGGPTTLYFSVFDSWDTAIDSAGVVDNVYVGILDDGECIPVVPPSAPQNLDAEPGQGQVELSWEAPEEEGVPAFDNYNVYRAVQGEALELVESTTDTSLTDTGLADGQNYLYAVAAENVVEGPSATVETTTLPGAPQNLEAQAGPLSVGGPDEIGTIELSWEAPDDAGAEIVAYHVYRADVGHVATLAGDVTEHSDDVAPVNPDAPIDGYTYEVTAENAGGEGVASDEATAAPLPPALEAPEPSVGSPGETCYERLFDDVCDPVFGES